MIFYTVVFARSLGINYFSHFVRICQNKVENISFFYPQDPRCAKFLSQLEILLLACLMQCLAPITPMKLVPGWLFRSWLNVFQLDFLHWQEPTKWPFGHWASIETTRKNLKSIHGDAELLFHSLFELKDSSGINNVLFQCNWSLN